MAHQTLVLIPGLICDDEVWRYVADHLAEVADCTIVPADTADTMQQLASDVLAPLGKSRFAVAGFSMGGPCEDQRDQRDNEGQHFH